MTLLSIDLARSGDIPCRSNNHLENGGRPTFCLNTVRNRPMWKNLKPFLVGVRQLGTICSNLSAILKIHYIEYKK